MISLESSYIYYSNRNLNSHKHLVHSPQVRIMQYILTIANNPIIS